MKDLSYIFPKIPADIDISALDLGNIPQHVAVIMDGNGRWAKARALNRLRGHKAGIEAVRETIRCANDLGVKFLSIYSFSTENWSRPQDEVDGLMNLFAKTMLDEVDGLNEEHVRVMTIGDTSVLPDDTREAFERAWELTCENDGMTLLVAINYGGRSEIVRAVNEWLAGERGATEAGEAVDAGGATEAGEAVDAGGATEASGAANAPQITEDAISAHLYTANIPEPELLIRTSGEVRVSNFMLWQIAYSEFVISNVLWPDFDRYEFLRCLLEYQKRNRRFGGTLDTTSGGAK